VLGREVRNERQARATDDALSDLRTDKLDDVAARAIMRFLRWEINPDGFSGGDDRQVAINNAVHVHAGLLPNDDTTTGLRRLSFHHNFVLRS
jgi:alpha-D-ribose 1-methylphosphonate 5-triphosphate synthase subunit PhnL